MLNYVIVIPARAESSRFPGKPMALINGVPMITHVIDACLECSSHVIVATDSIDIYDYVGATGASAIMTPASCKTGTDRVAEAVRAIECRYVINVQGDEPLVDPQDIGTIINAGSFCGATNGFAEITGTPSPKDIKVVMGEDGQLLYASRATIPGSKEGGRPRHKQVCIYGIRKSLLMQFYGVNKNKSVNEEVEDVEILRLVDNGIPVNMIKCTETYSVDYPEDVAVVEGLLNAKNNLL
jgi:3-deoxy-manno-octulosonate cytidylyltransferase (CMP-KDO synthetase)